MADYLQVSNSIAQSYPTLHNEKITNEFHLTKLYIIQLNKITKLVY